MKDNISGAIVRAQVQTKTSAKGNEYSVLLLTFNLPNDKTYQYRSDFLTDEQKTLIDMATPLKTNLLDDQE